MLSSHPSHLPTIHRLLLVDDHAVVRAGLKRTFSRCADLVVDAEAATGEEAVRQVRTRPFDAVLLDLGLPDRDGLDVLRRMRVERRRMPVVVVSAHPAATHAAKAIASGASGYLTKGVAGTEIVETVRRALAGRRAGVPGDEDGPARPASRSAHERLSSREFDVFLSFAAGLTPVGIAERRCVSINTVMTQRASILRKMQMRSVSELTYYAIKNALVL